MTSKPDHQKGLFRARLDQVLAQHDLDRRQHQRVTPSEGEPVLLVVDGRSLPLSSISRGGVALQVEGMPDPGWVISCELALPGRTHPLSVVLNILYKDRTGLMRAQFKDLDGEAVQAIEGYVQSRWQKVLALGA